MGYEYGFEYAFPEGMENAAEGAMMGAVGVIAGVFLIVYLLAMAFGVVSYVLNAVGMYRIAKRRGIHHAWLAWIPVGSSWLLGSISDHYQYVAKQKVTKRRRVMLILAIICFVAVVFLFCGCLGVFAAEEAAEITAGLIVSVVLMTAGYLGTMGLSIALTVFCYIAYFDLFRSCKPKNDVLFLVLSIIFNVTLPFFVFACSGSDEGMPVRRPQQPPQQIPVEPVYAEPAAEEIPVVEAEIVDDPEL